MDFGTGGGDGGRVWVSVVCRLRRWIGFVILLRDRVSITRGSGIGCGFVVWIGVGFIGGFVVAGGCAWVGACMGIG